MIKAIGFDQGGIIVTLDYNKPAEYFAMLGAKDAAKIYSQADQVEFIDEFERGKISAKNFRDKLKTVLHGLKNDITDSELDKVWNTLLLDINKPCLDVVSEYQKQGYVVFMFSNTDEIHQEGARLAYLQKGVEHDLEHYFDEVYLSHIFGFNKPSVEAFINVADDLHKKHRIKPNEILFVDDSVKHINGRNDLEGANNAGWHGLLVKQNLSANDLRQAINTEINNLKQSNK